MSCNPKCRRCKKQREPSHDVLPLFMELVRYTQRNPVWEFLTMVDFPRGRDGVNERRSDCTQRKLVCVVPIDRLHRFNRFDRSEHENAQRYTLNPQPAQAVFPKPLRFGYMIARWQMPSFRAMIRAGKRAGPAPWAATPTHDRNDDACRPAARPPCLHH